MSLIKRSISSYHAFDGNNHLMKVSTIAGRDDERNEANSALYSFYERKKDPADVSMDDDHAVAIKNIKKLTSRTSELVSLVKE